MIFDPAQYDAAHRAKLEQFEAFVFKERGEIYLNGHGKVSAEALAGRPHGVYVLAAILANEMAHVQGLDERAALEAERRSVFQFMKEGRIPVDVALEHFRGVELGGELDERLCHGAASRPAGHGLNPNRRDARGVLGFITAVYGVSLTPSDPLVVNRLGARRAGVVEGATLEQLVRTAGVAAAETCQMLVDHLPFAVVIADATGRVLLANDPALHALRLGEMIASRDGRIHVADPVASDRLQAAIERACTLRGSDLQPVLIPVTPEAPWRQVVVMGIARGLDARFAALLFPDSRRLNGAARILASLFAFTAAEARMAVLVLEGRTLAQAALPSASERVPLWRPGRTCA